MLGFRLFGQALFSCMVSFHQDALMRSQTSPDPMLLHQAEAKGAFMTFSLILRLDTNIFFLLDETQSIC